MIKRTEIILFSRLLTAYILFHCGYLLAQEEVMPVSVVTAKKGNMKEEVPLTGSIVSIRTSKISPKEEGYIESLMVDEGDAVKKGDPILYFDKQLAELETGRVRAQLDEARAQAKELIRQREEAAELVKKKHIASTSYESAAAQVEINAAVVRRLETELERQQTITERHTLYAPFNGIITDKMVEVGQWVDTNTALFELTELNPLRVEVPVPQFYFSRINTGTPVRIKYDAIPDREFLAEVTTKIPASNQNSRTFPVFIKINNDEQMVAPGMSARTIFQLSQENKASTVLLPRDAIVQKPDGSKTVWVVDNNQKQAKANPVNVKTGKSHINYIEITFGEIQKGDRVVVKGNELLQPGQSVDVIEELDYEL